MRKTRKGLEHKYYNRKVRRHTTMLVMGRTMQQKERKTEEDTNLEATFKQPQE